MNSKVPTPCLDGLRVLVVDDEPDLRLGMQRLVSDLGATVVTASRGDEALRILEQDPVELVVSDIRMPGLSGEELLREIKTRWPDVGMILVTGFGTIEQAVSCMKEGAAHFITKPFDNHDFQRTVSLVGSRQLARAVGAGHAIVAGPGPMRRLLDHLPRVAKTSLPILIEGETGTGKELVAREVHRLGPHPERPFLAVNCAALPDTLLESELFGYRRGAFTGADRDRDGLFVQARGGTVFLDEIASMSLPFQARLLRVLQEKVVRPLGADVDEIVDFRLVAATNRDLTDLVSKGEFRDDLLFRLKVLEVKVPPLRERRDDIPALARHFMETMGRECLPDGEVVPVLDASALDRLRRYSWPGNVRELENVILRGLVVGHDGRLRGDDLDLPDEDDVALDLDIPYERAKSNAVRRFQQRFVEDALRRARGNISQAARDCGMTRAALQRILQKLEIDRTSFES